MNNVLIGILGSRLDHGGLGKNAGIAGGRASPYLCTRS